MSKPTRCYKCHRRPRLKGRFCRSCQADEAAMSSERARQEYFLMQKGWLAKKPPPARTTGIIIVRGTEATPQDRDSTDY